MPQSVSRRKFLGVAAATALAPMGKAQETPKPPPQVEAVEALLASKLDAEAKKLLEAAIRSSEGQSKARLATKLPENSEPCFVYHVRGVPARRIK